MRLRRHLVAGAICFGGTAGVFGLVLSLNGGAGEPPPETERAPVTLDVAPKPPPEEKEPRPKRSRPKKSSASSAPTPSLGSSLAGLDLGLPGFELGDVAEDLLGDVQDLVMTEDAVDAIPRLVGLPRQPDYPARARSKGLTGFVVLSLRVGADGRVEDVHVVEAEPVGVFEEAALAAVRAWSFEAATYEGVPVAVRVNQTVRFDLDG